MGIKDKKGKCVKASFTTEKGQDFIVLSGVNPDGSSFTVSLPRGSRLSSFILQPSV